MNTTTQVYLGYFLVGLAFYLLTGCTALEQKGENYKRAALMAANPECVKIYYGRQGGNATFGEMRCTGKACDDIPACEGGDAE